MKYTKKVIEDLIIEIIDIKCVTINHIADEICKRLGEDNISIRQNVWYRCGYLVGEKTLEYVTVYEHEEYFFSVRLKRYNQE